MKKENVEWLKDREEKFPPVLILRNNPLVTCKYYFLCRRIFFFIGELTNRRPFARRCRWLCLFPIARAHKGIYRRLTAGGEVSFGCFLPILRAFLERLLRGEQIDCILRAEGATDRKSFQSCGLL